MGSAVNVCACSSHCMVAESCYDLQRDREVRGHSILLLWPWETLPARSAVCTHRHTDEDVCCVSNICKNTSKEKHLHKICFSNSGIACRLGFCAQVCMSMCNLLTVYLCYMNIISLVKRQKTAEVGPLTFTTFSNIINSGWGELFLCLLVLLMLYGHNRIMATFFPLK